MFPQRWRPALILVGMLMMTGCASGAGLAWLAAAALAFGLAACSGNTGAEDLSAPDSGRVTVDDGRWEPCCTNGAISECWCPANFACNYGAFLECGNGTCSTSFSGCPDAGPPDSGAPDVAPDAGDGTWESCCRSNQIMTCFCPSGVACNYGWFTDCGDGQCTSPGQPCP